jgi:predicted MPP superfamily phosphohydrolase
MKDETDAFESFTFAHLSDIHLAGYEPGATFDVGAELRRELIYDLEKVTIDSGSLDGVLIGGDIAGTGKAEEYVAAVDWIDQLGEKFGFSHETVYCVPGNHDVDQDVVKGDPVIRTLQETLLSCRVDRFNPLLERLVSSGPRPELITSPLEAYNEFAGRYRCAMGVTEHRWRQVLRLGPYALQIIGLASPIVSGPSDAKEGRLSALALGAQGTIGRFKDTFTIVLCHHPPSWLRDREFVEHYLQRGHLQLYGHEHTFQVAPSGAGLRVDAGAVHPTRDEGDWHPAYNVIALRPDEAQESVVTVDVYPRRLLDDGCFGPVDPEEPMQRFPISVALNAPPADVPPEPAQEPPSQNPPDERAIAYDFVGLSPERRLQIGLDLDLLGPEDEDLPEGVRMRRIFDLARENDKLDTLKEHIHA